MLCVQEANQKVHSGYIQKHESYKRFQSCQKVYTTGSNDVYVLDTRDGELLLPAIPEVIVEIDLDEGHVIAQPMEIEDAN